MLKRACDALNVKETPTRVGGTWWIPHPYSALKTFWTILPALEQHWKEVVAHCNKLA
jgi:hypothetical protein